MTDLLKTEFVTITLMPDGGHVTVIKSPEYALDDMEEFIVQQSIANKILRTRLDRLEAEALQYYEFAAYDTDTIKDQASEIKSLQSQLEEAKRINAEFHKSCESLKGDVAKAGVRARKQKLEYDAKNNPAEYMSHVTHKMMNIFT